MHYCTSVKPINTLGEIDITKLPSSNSSIIMQPIKATLYK